MAPAKLSEYLFGWPSSAMRDVVLTLTEGLVNVGIGSSIE
jgi:hypothetical protein